MEPRLPYDILLHIFQYLDPLDDDRVGQPAKLRDTPSSLLSIQRALGATLSLMSRDWRDLGHKYLWSNFILSFATERSSRKLGLLLGNEDVANLVKRIYVYCGIHDERRVQGVPIELTLPSLKRLESLELSASPRFVMKMFSQVDSRERDLVTLRHLVLDSSDEPSVDYPEILLRLVSKLPLLESLDLTLSLPSTGTWTFPAPSSKPLQSLRSFVYRVCGDNSGPSTLSNPFLISLLNLIDPHLVETFSVSCRTLPTEEPHDVFSTFLKTTRRRLSKLSVTCDRLTMERILPHLIETLPALTRLSSLTLGILPQWTAPLHLPSLQTFVAADELGASREPLRRGSVVSRFFDSLLSLEQLERISLDFDLTLDEKPIVIDGFLRKKWEQGQGQGQGSSGERPEPRTRRSKGLQRLEWHSWMSVSRYSLPIVYERREEGGWRREEQGHSFEIVGL